MGLLGKSFIILLLVLVILTVLVSSLNIISNNSYVKKEGGHITIEIDPCAEINFNNGTSIKKCIGNNG